MPFIPHTEEDIKEMLAAIGASSIDSLFDEIPAELLIEDLDGMPKAQRNGRLLHCSPAGSHPDDPTRRMHARAAQDGSPPSFIGAGAYEHHIPTAVWDIATRGEFYSAYTPYQAEASQGTLQTIYEYQSMITSLTGLDASNASLYDGASGLAEAIVYFLEPTRFRLVVNAATREKDVAWITEKAKSFAVDVTERAELAMIAVQGPKARALAGAVIPSQWREAALELKPFYGLEAGEWFVARTGYTGEDGWEIVMPAGDAESAWQALLDAGVAPCGLGARDTLRLEAGMNLYGTDMDGTTSPFP